MTDARLRELERRWRETGAVEDEATLLRERVRAGNLVPDRLKLAAHCGHAASALALGEVGTSADPDLLAWVRGLHAWGLEPGVRVALLAARVVLRVCRSRSGESPSELEPETVFSAVEAWIACPCEEHSHAAILAGASGLRDSMDGPLEDAGWACADAASAMRASPELILRALLRAERFAPAATAEVRAGIAAWALSPRP